MTLALPAAPPPIARRQLLIGTALACSAAAMLFGGMLAIYLRLRMRTVNSFDAETGESLTWLPEDVHIPAVAANNMLIAFLGVFVFAQWAVWAARRNQRSYTAIALALTALLGLAVVNAQAYIYREMGVGGSDGSYASLFYAVTGTFMVFLIGGIVFSVVTMFRYLGGRTREREIVAAHAH
jgi:heme/copper-type cytochrome/quinol oxidase subunit 3